MSVVELGTTEARLDGGDMITPTDPTSAVGAPPELLPEAEVEVRSRFDQRWAPGFVIVALDADGYRIRRVSDGAELPTRFSRDEIRRERRRGQWWY
jgi:hypothetical protein